MNVIPDCDWVQLTCCFIIKGIEMFSSTRVSFVVFCLAILIATPAVAQIDSSTLKSSPRTSASYESGRSTGNRMGFSGPEGSGRPGIFFFKKGVKAFDKDQYAFAIDMYEVAASWAYKPAQYNLSVMYSRGQGVPVDLPRAMAWIALAAERGDSRYVNARDAINVTLNSDQVAEANRILEQLKPKYADANALRKANRRWRDVKLDATGSKLGFAGGLKVGAPGKSSLSAGNVAYNASGITGGYHNDASIEYRQLQESSGPYEPEDRVRTGTVTIDALQIPDLGKAELPVTKPAEDPSHR